jgi:hypothetical protein
MNVRFIKATQAEFDEASNGSVSGQHQRLALVDGPLPATGLPNDHAHVQKAETHGGAGPYLGLDQEAE